MSDSPQNPHDPAADSRLEEYDDNDGTSSGILVRNPNEEHSSPEVSSLNSSAILDHPEDSKPEHGEKDAKSPKHRARPVGAAPTTVVVPGSTSTAVVDLNKTMPWKLFYPIASRETIISLCKATAINLILPFINGVFLGFGEICAHELAYLWGWTNSAHVVNVPGRRPANVGSVGISAAGSSGSPRSGFAGSRSGIGGLEDKHESGSSNGTEGQ